MWSHFVNFLRESGNAFLSALGTTGLGWWVQGIIWFIATEAATFLVIRFLRGKAAMKEHLAGNFRVGIYVWLIVMTCVYAPLFGWFVMKGVYADHQSLVATVRELKNAPKPACPICPAPKSASHGLKVMYGDKPLDGMTIQVTTGYMTMNGKVMNTTQENFGLDAFRVKNVGSVTTGTISATLYLSSNIQGMWNQAPSDEPDFQFAWNMVGGNYPSRIDALQTISLEPYYGMTAKPWPVNEIVTARLKIFYGADKPAIVNFKLRKIGMVKQ